MRRFAAAAVLSFVLATAPAFGQATSPKPSPPQGTPPAQGTPPPGQTPAPTQTPPIAPAPARPFPEGAKIAYINIQRVANESSEGKAATAKVQALVQKKQAEANERNKALQADQQKLAASSTIMSDAARAELEKKIERQNVEIQRMTQDAQQEVQELQQELQNEFQRKLMPVVQKVFDEKNLHALFSAADAGLVLADPGLDITAEVIKRFDSGGPATAAPKPPATKPPGQQR